MDFTEFPKMARLSRPCVITEKIDGTNASVVIEGVGEAADPQIIARRDGMAMYAGSRTRFITPDADNFGFAAWVKANADELFRLGPGQHFGEWWGSGIQRGYGLQKGEKRFSLFNTGRWSDPSTRPSCCDVVPVITSGIFTTKLVEDALLMLTSYGSYASKGFMKPEGIVVWHEAARMMFKKTIEKDDVPKGRQ